MNEDKFYSFIGIIKKSGNLVSGYNNCIFEIKKDKCKLVILAEDASENTKSKFTGLCDRNQIPYIIYGSKEKLGTSIGMTPKSVVSVRSENMSKVVLNMLK